jgi:arylsulfatase A
MPAQTANQWPFWFFVVICFLLALGTPQRSDAAQRPPNIVMILCDDLGYSDLGSYGNRIIQTPHLDRLAARGTRFTQFYAASPVCTPSRAALMTGHYPQRYGIFRADGPETLPRQWLPESAITIAEVLKQAGYFTTHIGKWHLEASPETVVPRKQGFDYFFGNFGGRPSSPWLKYARSVDPEIIVNENRPVVYKGHVTEVQTSAVLEVLAKVKRDQPFFLNLWYNAPHEPLAPLPYQDKLYRDWSLEEQTYFQTVSDLDKAVGQILAKLDEVGVTNDTVIFFTSDNGPEAHNQINQYSRGTAWPLKGMKTQLWEGGIRVPAILCWPGRVPEGKTSTTVVSVLDVFLTFCTAARVSIPTGITLDSGIDLVAVARADLKGTDRLLFFENHFRQRGVASSLPMAVRSGKWKLFSNHEFSVFELYDLDNDIGEQNNVAAQHPSVVKELKHRLAQWWAQFAEKVDLNEGHTRVPVPSLEELERKYYKD